jgi:hypothetical protein
MKSKNLLRSVWLLVPLAIGIVFIAKDRNTGAHAVIDSPAQTEPAGQISKESGLNHSCGAECGDHDKSKEDSGSKVAVNTKLPELDSLFKSFDRRQPVFVSRQDFAPLDQIEKGGQFNITLGDHEFTGIVVAAQLSSFASKYAVSLDDYDARLVVSIDGNDQFRAYLGFADESRMLLIEETATGDEISMAVQLSTASQLFCLPDGAAYPIPQNAAVSSMVKAPSSKVGPTSSTVGSAPPALESIPGSEFTIYIDFDGEQVVDDADWGSVTAAPHPRANDEAWVTWVWERVVEDFAPFAINVTTDRSVFNATDEDKRLQVIVTPTQGFLNFDEDIGGIAGIGSFRDNSPIVWCFNLTEYYCADTISHEVGHSMGLFHDGRTLAGGVNDEYYGGHGTGVTSWAPIMGASWDDEGTFFLEHVTQWSIGEYEFAKNQQDDLSIIGGNSNGFGFKEDLIANDLNPAPGDPPFAFFTQLLNQEVTADGVIERRGDVDVFQFSTDPGLIDLTVSPLDVDSSSNEFGADRAGANLAVGLVLYDGNGVIVASDNPENSMSANISTEVDGGVYYLAVSGESRGADPSVGFSDYGSLGQYTVSGSIAAPPITILGGAKQDQNVFNGDVTPSLLDGTDFGFHYPSGGTKTYAFNIQNISSLDVTNISANFPAGSAFSVLSLSPSIPGGQTGFMTIGFDPNVTGIFEDSLSITYTGALLTPLTYTFSVAGTSTPAPLTDNYAPKGAHRFYEDTDLNGVKNVWLSDYKGLAIQSDIADWYSFNVSENDFFLIVEMSYDPSLGDLELNLYDRSGGQRVGVKSATGGEQTITYIIPDYAVGVFSKFYAQVTSPTSGVITNNAYDLRWRTIEFNDTGDDFYEDNDSQEQAFNLTGIGESRLSELVGLGVQNDDDWYRIDVPADPRVRFLYVDCIFDNAQGNIDVELYGPTFFGDGLLQLSNGDSDRETISQFEIVLTSDFATVFNPTGNTVIVGVEPGTYYVRVFGDNAGNTYDLTFETREDDNYEIVDASDDTENDTFADPFNLGSVEDGLQLSDVAGIGVIADYAPGADSDNFTNLNDDDWFRFEVDPSNVEQVTIDFVDIGGALGFELARTNGLVFDSSMTRDREFDFDFETGNFIASGVSLTIDNPTESAYLIRVFALDPIDYLTAYDFRFNLSSEPVIPEGIEEDAYEENEKFFDGYDISSTPGVPLSAIGGFATLTDPDWYKIVIPQNAQNLEISANFADTGSELTVLLADELGRVGFESVSSANRETISWPEPTPGVYYIGINGDYVGTTYNLIWDYERLEDAYEENDERQDAYDLSADENTWLSKIAGKGVQADEDWFQITVPGDAARLEVQTDFNPIEGDIDLEVYSDAGFIVARSVSASQEESVVVPGIAPGVYFIRIYFGDAGNEYDLWWSAPSQSEISNRIEDNYEENDSLGGSFALGTQDQRSLSSIDGNGTQTDEDWYSFVIEDGNFGLRFDLEFTHAEGDIDLEILDSLGNLVALSRSTNDNESINYNAPLVPGTYYARIYGSNVGNQYDFFWVDFNEDVYEENDIRAEAYDISLFPDTNLSSSGTPTQGDDDWFKVTVGQNNSFLLVELDYVHANGNIDLEVYNASNGVVADSLTTDNTEAVFVQLPAGDYFIKVFGDNAYNDYDLLWNVFEDDVYEENDTRLESADIIGEAGTQVNGAQFDDDWYRVNVSDANSTLFVNLSFIHADGNIDLELYDSSNAVLASSASTSDSEVISLQVPVAGDYFIRVFGANLNTSYSLIWNAVLDDAFEENDTLLTAANITGSEETPLDGVELDEDWFRIDLPAGDVRFEAILSFLNDEGDLTLALYDSSENLLRSSSTTNDGEQIIFGPDPAGATYYLLVSGPSIGTDYTLTWSSTQRDGYEGESGNNTIDDAFDISAVEGRFLTEFEGQSTLFDEDWYRIERNGEGLLVQAEFLHAEGNIDIDLYNNVGDRILVGTSATDLNVERIVYAGGSNGTYYIRVYGDLNGNAYDLFWRDFNEDDEEVFLVVQDAPDLENDISSQAVSLVDNELELIDNLTQLDDDWYRIEVEAGDRLTIDCQFEHLGGDIDIELYEDLDPLGAPVAFSNSQTDNEFIDIDTLPAGDYLLRVHGRTLAEVALGDAVKGRDLANTYSLRWNSATEDPYDLPDNNNQRIDAYELLPQLVADDAGYDLRNRLLGDGVQFDDDWYKVDINLGSAGSSYFFFVDLILDNSAQGNLDLELYDENGVLLRTSATDSAREAIVYSAISGASVETLFIRVLGENVGQSYNLSVGTLPDDRFEDNDTPSLADSVADLTDDRGVSVPGLFQVDDDYYAVDVPAGELRLLVDIFFQHNFGNLSLEVFNAAQQSLGRAATSNDDETLDVFIPEAGGRFYILVEGPNDRVPYRLQWNYTDEDRYEENDDFSEAFELTEFEGNDPPVPVPLYPLLDDGEALGIATQTDEDWYAVTLPASHISLFVDIDFDHLLGDLALAVYDATGTTLLGSADSADDNETLAVPLPGGEVTYLIRVEGPDSGNRYSLAWSSSPEDLYEQNDFITEAYDLTSDEGIDLSLINGQGATLDDDWYVIVVSDNSTIMEVGLAFSGASPIFEVYQLVDADPIEENDDGIDQRRAVLLPRPDTSASRSVFSLANPMPGLYYIRVSSLTGRQNYDLDWSNDGDSSGDAVYTDDLGNFVFSNPNPAIRPADFDENPDGDAFPNWAEFALGLSETSYDAQVTSQGLQEVGGVDYFTIEFIRSKEAVNRGFIYIVEESNNLTFDGDEAVFVATESISATHERVTYRSSAPIKDAPACFFKVRVQQPSDGF